MKHCCTIADCVSVCQPLEVALLHISAQQYGPIALLLLLATMYVLQHICGTVSWPAAAALRHLVTAGLA